MTKIKVIFVCLGNICRSTLAEGIMKDYIIKNGLEDKFIIDSAGTSAYHLGSNPDQRSINVAIKHGIKLNHKARQLTIEDCEKFDFILVMDQMNYEDSLIIATKENHQKIFLLRSFHPEACEDFNIIDTYYGINSDFEEMYYLCMDSIKGFIKYLKEKKLL